MQLTQVKLKLLKEISLSYPTKITKTLKSSTLAIQIKIRIPRQSYPKT